MCTLPSFEPRFNLKKKKQIRAASTYSQFVLNAIIDYSFYSSSLLHKVLPIINIHKSVYIFNFFFLILV